MPDSILYQVDQLTLKETCLIHREASLAYSSIGGTSIRERRPLVWLGVVGVLGLLGSGLTWVCGAGLLGPRLSLKLSLLIATPSVALAVYGFTHKVSCLQLWIDQRPVTVLRRKDRHPVEVAQRVIETAKRAYGTAGTAATARAASDLRSDLNPL